MPAGLERNDGGAAARDDWFESEESTRLGMIEEVQRIRRRTLARPLPVILLALLITSAIGYKLATKPQSYRAEVVLALREGSLGPENKATGLPLGELRQLVATVLLPDARLGELIERRDLHRLRERLGIQWAIDELRGALEIDVWRNTFVYYDPENPHREASARIALTVADGDPDLAYLLARDLAEIVIDEVRGHRLQLTRSVATEIAAMRDGLSKRMLELELERTERMVQHARAVEADKTGVAHAIHLRLTEIDRGQKATEESLSQIVTSQDALADRIAEAGLDLVVEVVSERRPVRPESRGLLLTMSLVVVAVGSLLGSALVLGAFDSRIHDLDDIARLGLPVLGHVPGFPGDRVGSLEARGVQHARATSRSRWRLRR